MEARARRREVKNQMNLGMAVEHIMDARRRVAPNGAALIAISGIDASGKG